MMCSLRGCLEYARQSGRILIPLTDKHDIIGSNFYNFFRLLERSEIGWISRLIATPEEITWAMHNYRPPHKRLPADISDTFISGQPLDSRGAPRYIINGITSLDGDEWYLHPPSTGKWEENQFTLSWGHFNKYWPSMLAELLEEIVFTSEIQAVISSAVSNAIQDIREPFLAVHFRNTDYKSPFETISNSALIYCKSSNVKAIYWASDDMSTIKMAQHFFRQQSINVFNYTLEHDIATIRDAVALHALPTEYLQSMGISQRDLTIQFLCDVFILSCGREFLGASGTVPFLVNTLRADSKRILKIHILR